MSGKGQSQRERICRHLDAGGSLTPLEALRMFGCMRLGARVYDLQRQGYPVVTEMVRLANGKRVARYRKAGSAS
jgi:hypothetical protein